MSHTVTMQTEIKDPRAMAKVCERLGLELMELSSENPVRLNGRHTEGHAVKLEGWRHPIILQLNGEIKFDNYSGRWGHMDKLNKFKQLYTIEAAKIAARKQGMMCCEKTLADGSIRLELTN